MTWSAVGEHLSQLREFTTLGIDILVGRRSDEQLLSLGKRQIGLALSCRPGRLRLAIKLELTVAG